MVWLYEWRMWCRFGKHQKTIVVQTGLCMGTYIGRGFGGMGGGLGVKGHHRGGSEPVDPDPDPARPILPEADPATIPV